MLRIRFGCAAMLARLLVAPAAHAQLPSVPEASGTSQKPVLSNDQIRDVLMLRALQSRGSRGNVKRGVPQFVPYGSPWFMGMPAQNAQRPAGESVDPKRAARTQRLRHAREEAVAKREAAVKRRAKARADAAAKAKARAKVAKDDPA